MNHTVSVGFSAHSDWDTFGGYGPVNHIDPVVAVSTNATKHTKLCESLSSLRRTIFT